MKRWKIIKKISLVVVILALFFFAVVDIKTIAGAHYPHEVFGAAIINNWFEDLCLNFILYIPITIVFVVAIVLHIVSRVKIKKNSEE